MLYSQADRDTVTAQLKKRSAAVWIPAVLLLLLAVAAFVWYRLRHDESGWIVSGTLTILSGAYAIFFYGVYLGPMRKYKKHLDYMLTGHKRITEGTLKAVTTDVIDRDGIDCYTVEMNIGEKGDPEDDRVFYLDQYKSMAGFTVGDRIRVESNDRLIAAVTKL